MLYFSQFVHMDYHHAQPYLCQFVPMHAQRVHIGRQRHEQQRRLARGRGDLVQVAPGEQHTALECLRAVRWRVGVGWGGGRMVADEGERERERERSDER